MWWSVWRNGSCGVVEINCSYDVAWAEVLVEQFANTINERLQVS